MTKTPLAPDPKGKEILSHFGISLGILDETEPKIRDIIESSLMNKGVAKVRGIKAAKAKDTAIMITKQIMAIRTPAIKTAMRHLRDNLPRGL